MVTFNVTIDEESHSDLFLRLMEELKFVVSVKTENSEAELIASDFARSGRLATDKEIEQLMMIADESEPYTASKSKKVIKQQFDQWLKKNI
jgi:hypothetical protein